MDAMRRDVQTAVRGLVRKPFFTLVAGVTLAVGIGANTAIYSVVDGVLINPLPFPEAHRLVSYNHQAPGLGVNVPVIPHNPATYLYYHERARAVEAFAVMRNANVNLITDGDPRQIDAAFVTRDWFDVMGVQPAIGRGFVESEDRPGAEPVAVLGHALWEQSFGRDPSVLGTLVEMNGTRRRIIGVMPPDFTVLDEELWLPLTIDDEAPDGGSLGLIGFARLAPGATPEDANVEMQDLLRRYADDNPDALPAGVMAQARFAADVKPLKEIVVQDVRQVLWVLLGTVGIVLLVACANVANLFLVRAEERQGEQALRCAIGASRFDIARQYLAESVLLAAGAGLVGLGLAGFGVKGLLALAPADLPQALDIGIDGSVLAFTACISLLSGILFGLLPAVGTDRSDLSDALKDGGRAATGGRERMRARGGLVIAQVALALVLLVGSGLMLRSFVALRSVDPGFASEGLLTFRVGLPTTEYEDHGAVLDFYRRLEDRLAAIPGASSVGVIDGLPLTGAKSAGPMEPMERPFPEDELGPMVERRSVSPAYFETMSIPLVAGRLLTWTDQADELRAIVVSETLARAFWPGKEAVGKSIRDQGPENEAWDVVGVVADVRFDDVTSDPIPLAYFPIVSGNPNDVQPARTVDVIVGFEGAPHDGVPAAREALRVADPRLPMINPRSVETIVEDSMASTSFTVVLLGIAAGVALLLGMVGIYGVIAYVVSRRTQEIGVRIALGAPTGVVLGSFVRSGMKLTAAGLGLGLLASLGISGGLASLLYGVTATDPFTFVGMSLLLAVVSLIATWVPARRAARVDPVVALRAD